MSFEGSEGRTLRQWLLDRLVLSPTRQPIETGNKRREVLPFSHGEVELWIEQHPAAHTRDELDLLVIKFPGTAGRAERASTQPLSAWDSICAEVWAVNPPGYGRASGRATLAATAPMVDALIERLQKSPRTQVLLAANSLGNLAALALAAAFPVQGLLLRNPPPLPDVVRRRSRQWRAGWFGEWVATRFPVELDPQQNAARCHAAALFIHSELDQLVPLSMQLAIAEAYAGPKQSFIARGSDHADPIPEEQSHEFLAALDWLGDYLFPAGRAANRPAAEPRPDTPQLGGGTGV